MGPLRSVSSSTCRCTVRRGNRPPPLHSMPRLCRALHDSSQTRHKRQKDFLSSSCNTFDGLPSLCQLPSSRTLPQRMFTDIVVVALLLVCSSALTVWPQPQSQTWPENAPTFACCPMPLIRRYESLTGRSMRQIHTGPLLLQLLCHGSEE